MHRGLFRSEFARFLVVGFTSVAIDFVSYRALLAFGVAVGAAKACGYVVGAIFGYFANRIFTFRVETHWHWQETGKFNAPRENATLGSWVRTSSRRSLSSCS